MRQIEAQVGQTVGLAVLEPGTGCGRVLAAVEGTSGIAFHIEENYLFPIHTAAPGKSILAYCSQAERLTYYEKMDFKRYTPSTITTLDDFEAELESVVEKGYSMDVSEELEGCHCVGVPVFDLARNVVAGLWVTGPSSQLPVRSFDQVSDVLKKGAQEIRKNLSETSRASNRDSICNVVRQAREILERNADQTVDLPLLASNLYVSYSWFRKVFKEEVGYSPREFHQRCRLDRSIQLLQDTTLSVRVISERLAFGNQNHFSAWFKGKTGQSPLAFREESVLGKEKF